MSDFTRPEYESYVELCRELKLERQLRNGDWYVPPPPRDDLGVYGWIEGEQDLGTEDGLVWLPALSDWLDMLEEEGVFRTVSFVAIADGGYRCTAVELEGPREPWSCRTREEAAARLWMAVRAPAKA